MEFKANETRHLEIVFKPQPPGTESLIYICVNDSQDRVIETIAVSAKVRSSASTATVRATQRSRKMYLDHACDTMWQTRT
eukprot:COSAG01_NODE_596_length_15055_cov_17.624967_7_plen_80_part_00